MISSGECAVNPGQRVHDGRGQRLHLLFVGLDPRRGRVERAARILAAEHVERVFLRPGIAEDLQVRIAALQHRDRRIQHHGGIDLALLHRRHRGRAKTDADHRRAGRIEAVLLQEVFQEEIRRGARRADADLLAGKILDRFDLAIVRGRHYQHQTGIAVIDHESLQLLLLGGQVDAMVEIAGNHVGAAAEHRLERVGAALQIDQFDGKPGLVVLAELLGQHRRQIAQAGAAPDRDGDLALRCGKARRQYQRQQRPGQPAQSVLHGFLQLVGRDDNAVRPG